MNWLFYLSGWFLGWAFWNGFLTIGGKKDDGFATSAKLITWTMMWIWICWKFVK
jgi:hypothetical protein